MWDNIGLKDSIADIEKSGFKVPANIKTMMEKGGTTFYRVEKGKKQFWDFGSMSYKDVPYSPSMIFLSNIKADASKVVKGNASCSLIDIGDGVFCLEYHTKMNAINGEIVDFIPEVTEYVDKNAVGLVIGNQASGMPGAFSAGGDLKFMGGLAAAKKFNEIEKFITNVHVGLKGIKYSGFPVVAAPYGMALGGGCECCLWSDKIVAHCELYMGLVEIGAGLLPAGGGCTNLWRRISEAPITATTDWLTAFLGAFQQIAMAKVGMSAMEARKAGFLRATDRIIFNKDYLLGEAKKEVLRMVEDGYVAPAKTGIKVMGQAALGAVDANLPDMLAGGMITPHMAHIARTIAYVLSGGQAMQGTEISEDAMLKLEIDAFVDLWKTENTQKMADHMATKGKPLFL
jgi:3-hydroxyacyl-CoA dehydrogenase